MILKISSQYLSTLHKSLITRYIYQMSVSQFNPNHDYYQSLNLNKNATPDQIKKQFYKLAKMYHPDTKSGNEEKFKLINEAYTILSDQKLKKQYDISRQSMNSKKYQQSHYNNYHSPDWGIYRRGGNTHSKYRQRPQTDNQRFYQAFRERQRFYREQQQQLRKQAQTFFDMIKQFERQSLRRQQMQKERRQKVKKMQEEYFKNENILFENTLIGLIIKKIVELGNKIWKWLLKWK